MDSPDFKGVLIFRATAQEMEPLYQKSINFDTLSWHKLDIKVNEESMDVFFDNMYLYNLDLESKPEIGIIFNYGANFKPIQLNDLTAE
jgi:hypothetical protein